MSNTNPQPPVDELDINSPLQRFVNNPLQLREKLRGTNGLISGGFALQVLAGVEWPESDLDICVQRDRAPELISYLVEVEGYDLCSRLSGKYGWTEVEEVHAFDKPSVADPQTRKLIEVVFTKRDPIRCVLSECYTTALVNVISWDAAYCLFPTPTLLHRLTFSLKEPDDFHDVLLRKYRARGYRDLRRLPAITSGTVVREQDEMIAAAAAAAAAATAATDGRSGVLCDATCFSGINRRRRVGDEWTRKVGLSTEGLGPSSELRRSSGSSSSGGRSGGGLEDVCFDIVHEEFSENGAEWMRLVVVD